MTRVHPCTCPAEKPGPKFQEKTYGKGNRVFNQTEKSDKGVWRCTCCGNEINIGK